MDFGIAHMRTSDVRTQTGLVLGSPKYMSPEQVRGARADARSDIFALGVILYEMLVGAPPFVGEDVSGLMYAIVHDEPPPPTNRMAGVPAMLDLIVAKSLAKTPDGRYATADQLADDLRACLGEPPPDASSAPRTSAAPMERTLPLDAIVAATRRMDAPSGAAQGRPLSRHFDSTAAARRLAAGSPPAAGTYGRNTATSRRGWAAREKLIVAAGVTIAMVVAAAIALG